jgi:xanthine dehydrogenase large subunit
MSTRTHANWKTRPHDSAVDHVQGLSEFIDDRPRLSNEVSVGIVLSEKAHARILSIDLSEVYKLEGVYAVYSADDFAHNIWGTIFQDQPLLAKDKVNFVGEAILIVAAQSQDIVDKAKRLVKIKYEELPPILSIGEACKQQSFIGDERFIKRGDAEGALAKSSHQIQSSIIIQGAEHFYLESQAAVVYPLEASQLEVHSSAQHPTEVQHVVAHGLGLESKDVVSIVKRMGGGFGGKESQSAPIAAYAALVAHKLKRPARIILNKDDDMIHTGKRNPFENEYTVGFDDEGRILALDAKLFSDGGAYADLSTSILERAMLHSDNAYFIPNMKVVGRVCRTHMHPHTAFRGFGGPKGALMIEKIIEEIAHYLKKDALEIRKLNVYRDGFDVTHYGQKVENNVLPELFKECEEWSEYIQRRREIDLDNQKSVEHDGETLRGLSMTAVKFGISFTTRFLNQGNALINVYRDGSVQVSTGATEMGQGVYGRIAQIVSEELGVSYEKIRVMPTSTEKNANTSPTAASSGTDINGAAAAKACQQIRARLSELFIKLLEKEPARWASKTAGLGTETEIEVLPQNKAQDMFEASEYYGVQMSGGWASLRSDPTKKIRFADLCNEAYLNRISLCEYAHYKIPNLSFNKLTGQVDEVQNGNMGGAFLYYTQGVAASEILLNRITGEVKVLRSDILMDLGRPVNEALDLGQVTGAFIQGMGWMSTENLFYSESGKLLSHSPSTYKIPSIHDIPREFNVRLLENHKNVANVRGTKAVGEPPLLLAISVWTAIQNALCALPEYANKAYPRVRVPATAERIVEAMNPEIFKR